MALFLEDLKTFLEVEGYGDIYRDQMPDLDVPDDIIGLFIYSHSIPDINDGSGTRYVQIQVRRKDPDEAYRVAHAMAALLDSSGDEDIINLTADRWCIARPRTMPTKLRVDGNNRTTYYFEVALWGHNDP